MKWKIKKPTDTLNRQKQRKTEEQLRRYAFQAQNDLFLALNANGEGLSSVTALERLEENGPNQISVQKRSTPLRRLADSFLNPFNLILFLVAVITLATDLFSGGKTDYTTVIIITVLICISSLTSFIQGERSNNAAAGLSKMISNRVDVFRDHQVKEIDITEVVVGDIVKLSAGDIIPGDLLFLTTKDAFISQAALTGESNPVEKFSTRPKEEKTALTDIHNLGFMGSNVVSGTATGLVLTTGNSTYFGSMAQSLSGVKGKSSFERGVDGVSHLLLRCMLIMVPLIFLINGFTKGHWGDALTFALTVAVGLTPEMLPVIMTSTLAKGAVSMSKHETIVKNLNSIQTFGEMDILCTDKTGTLTEDKIVLEKYMNPRGQNDDARVLKHAYLNSYFQTGLKNLIDMAVINRGDESNFQHLQTDYILVDEIPFDFSRRRMSVILDDENGKRQLITKGAVDEIMSACKHVILDDKAIPLTDELRKEALDVCEQNASEGLRVIAIAERNHVEGIENFTVNDETDLVLLGFIGFLDPPKKSAMNAIAALKENGVRVVVLTGDSEGVAVKVCQKVGVDVSSRFTGQQVEEMDEPALDEAVRHCNLFSKLSPSQKERVVGSFQKSGHTVGYMGDGINDAPALRKADVGISVDSAVDIAKETADIILLKKDLMVLEEGVVEGRKTFANILKYLKMAVSGNFGNMISVTIASIFLPFLPLLPAQILTQNLLCDFSQLGIPFDNVDSSYIKKPRRWDTKSLTRFMLQMGSVSSFNDVLCWGVMWFIMGAGTSGQGLFQNGWFLYGTLSQILIVFLIRTEKLPWVGNSPSPLLVLSSSIVAIVTLLISFTAISAIFDMIILPLSFLPWLVLLLLSYCILAQVYKYFYIRRYKEWL